MLLQIERSKGPPFSLRCCDGLDTLDNHAKTDIAKNSLGQLSPGAAIPAIYTQASPNPNGLNPNVPVGRNSVGIADRDR
jgi:hypothetical protein